MSKFYGRVGYAIDTVPEPGIHETQIVEKMLYGETIENFSRNWNDSNSINGDLRVNVKLSLVADAFAIQNYQNIRYAEYQGVLWNVTEVKPDRPRLYITLGGIYNGQQAESPSET